MEVTPSKGLPVLDKKQSLSLRLLMFMAIPISKPSQLFVRQWRATIVDDRLVQRTKERVHCVCHLVGEIQHLDQLADPESVQLFLFSLRIVRDSLAGNSVRSLATAARNALSSNPPSRADLTSKLALRGYTPTGRAEADVGYRVVEEALYRVADGFPRLLLQQFPQGLPHGVAGISYQLDMTACGPWRTDATADRWSP